MRKNFYMLSHSMEFPLELFHNGNPEKDPSWRLSVGFVPTEDAENEIWSLWSRWRSIWCRNIIKICMNFSTNKYFENFVLFSDDKIWGYINFIIWHVIILIQEYMQSGLSILAFLSSNFTYSIFSNTTRPIVSFYGWFLLWNICFGSSAML